MKKIGYPRDYFEPKYECSKCKDTGFVTINNTNQYCNCFRQKLVNYEYNQNNLLKLEDENFKTFDSGFFSKEVNKEKYKSDKSPYDNIMQIKKIAEDFCVNIGKKEQKSLMFVGPTGTGKTFMSNAIAKEVINKGYSVIYQTAPILMDMLINSKFKSLKDGNSKEQYDNVFDVDVLIIDDLGTETLSNTKFTELFNIINTRLLKDKKTIISTNLNLNELASFYDERVISRIIGNYIICRFFGDDVRLKAKKTSKS